MIEEGEKSRLELAAGIEEHSRWFYSCILYVQNKGPNLLRTVVPCPSDQAQTIEFSLESEKIPQVQF